MALDPGAPPMGLIMLFTWVGRRDETRLVILVSAKRNICIYIYIYICITLHVYIYIYIHIWINIILCDHLPLQPSSRNCSPASDLELWKLMFQMSVIFRRSASSHRHRYAGDDVWQMIRARAMHGVRHTARDTRCVTVVGNGARYVQDIRSTESCKDARGLQAQQSLK